MNGAFRHIYQGTTRRNQPRIVEYFKLIDKTKMKRLKIDGQNINE